MNPRSTFFPLILALFFAVPSVSQATPNQVEAFFTPDQGESAFREIYATLASAQKEALITVYSWSDKDLDQAILQALSNGATVRLVLHPELTAKKNLMDRCADLESHGAQIKIAPRNMHEKFVLVDGAVAINSSANFSIGARKFYSENIVFIRALSALLSRTIRDEFAFLWDASRDLITHQEPLAPFMGGAQRSPKSAHSEEAIQFYSSSMNLIAKETQAESEARKSGKALTLRLRTSENPKDAGGPPWVVRDLIIESIDAAQVRIEGNLNHFNIREIADALLRADARGVDVRLNVDQQEYQTEWNPDFIEMTPYFVSEWRKSHPGLSPPVRIKTYSLEPTPAHWLLNHHKIFLIDYVAGRPLLPSTRLLTGSYNFSRTAEHAQFDNMIEFRGETHKGVYQAFADEFRHLWQWGRTSSDQLDENALNRWLTIASDGTLGLHFHEAQALSWTEMEALRERVKKLAPGLLENLTRKTAECSRYHVVKKQFLGCPNP